MELPAGLEAEGAILADQIKSLDWRGRRAKRFCVAPEPAVEETLGKILALLEPP